MYKVDIEDINKKLGSLHHYRKNNIALIVMFLFGTMLFVGIFEDTADPSLALISVLFTIFFLLHFIIFPLMGKIELMEQDIRNLKAVTNIEDEKHY